MQLRQMQAFSDSRVRALFGLSRGQLGELLSAVLPVLCQRRLAEQRARPCRQRAVGGGRKRCVTPAQEVLMTLVYLRHNVAHAVCGQLFGVSADKSEQVFHEVVRVLKDVCPSNRWDAQKRWQKGQPSWNPDQEDLLLVDSFETPIPHPGPKTGKERDKRFYSGKKRRHTLKSQVLSDAKGEILSIHPGLPGPTADKRILEQTSGTVKALCPHAKLQGDLAYIGTKDIDMDVIVPHRRKNCQKTPNELTEEQKAENRELARVRVHVEHGIRRIKAWRLMRDEFRLAVPLFAVAAHAVVGLVQMSRLCS